MVAVPSFVRANARRGLDLLEFAGDGLKQQTINEARAMARGTVTPEKVRRMAAWFARHAVDLSSPDAQAYLNDKKDRPTAGQVAWLLWGGDLGANKLRAMEWAERKRDQLIEEGELSKAISATVRDGLETKANEHNESVGSNPSKRVTVSMLAQVYERGIGAYRTNPSSVRPNVTSPEQWAYARVNAFLRAVRSGKYQSGKFDTDLLPEGHPLSTRKTAKETNVSEADKDYGYEMKDEYEGGECPIATRDVAVNLANRQKAIEVANYGPLNPDEENADYWQGIAERWDTTIAEAKKQRCGNCAVFIRTPSMLECIEEGLETGDGDAWSSIEAGVLGYCEAFDFKCAASRTCDAWVAGGPVTEEPNETDEDEEESETDENEDVYGGAHDGARSAVRREIVESDGQYCVVSTTGRAFGCYSSRDQAVERLEQIERFADKALKPAGVDELIVWHKAAHALEIVDTTIKSVHDLIEDELELTHGLAFPYEKSLDEKLAMAGKLGEGWVSKSLEYRYTLGPAYVPNREDAHGEFTDSETLQKAMWDWVRAGDRTIYLQHSDKPAGEMVELLTWPFPIDAELTVPNQGVTKFTFPADTPFLGVVWEEWAWELVKAGELRGYSIGGSARRVEADLPVNSSL